MIDIREDLLIQDSRPYVLWRRVSTKEQGRSGLGLDAQVTLAMAFTKKDPVKIFTDVYSGTKLRECRGLWDAIAFCKENGYLLVVAKTDRFRNAKEALEVLDEIGERNIAFCDLPNVDRMILTIMFSVWERQAYMGRINTKLALDERKRILEENGGWISKSGRWCTGLGGTGKSPDKAKREAYHASMEAARIKHERWVEWAKGNMGYQWIIRQVKRGVPRKEIIEEYNYYHSIGMEGFSTFEGCELSAPILCKWLKRGNKSGFFNRNADEGKRNGKIPDNAPRRMDDTGKESGDSSSDSVQK